MDFLAAAQHYATDLSSDFSMDPTMEDAAMPGKRTWSQPEPRTDDQDPATPGGAAPYNGVAPFGDPVVTDPEWLDPQGTKPSRYMPMPHIPGPDLDVTTLHNARLTSYENKVTRFR
jgi:hypothetical protein